MKEDLVEEFEEKKNSDDRAYLWTAEGNFEGCGKIENGKGNY